MDVEVYQASSDHFTANEFISYFGYAQFCGILVGPVIGFVFDRSAFKCKQTVKSDTNHLLIASADRLFLDKLQSAVLPFFLTNLVCLLFSFLAMAKWKSGLVSIVLRLLINVVTIVVAQCGNSPW